jgi:hypothetical protein
MGVNQYHVKEHSNISTSDSNSKVVVLLIKFTFEHNLSSSVMLEFISFF